MLRTNKKLTASALVVFCILSILGCNLSMLSDLVTTSVNSGPDSATEPLLIENGQPTTTIFEESETAAIFDDDSIQANPIDGAWMVFIPAGKYYMGTGERWEGMQMDPFFYEDKTALEHEMPSHRLTMDAFWFYQTHVTNAQFSIFIETTGYQTHAEAAGVSYNLNNEGEWIESNNSSWQQPDGPDSSIMGLENHPVVHVTWADAAAYCEWAGGRLPTEAEWERVGKGMHSTFAKYPWGGDLPSGQRANFCDVNCPLNSANEKQDDGFATTSPVGQYPLGSNQYNAMDLAGNVWDWIWDWYDQDYYLKSPHENPMGPSSGREKVIRGGGWNSNNFELRVTNRDKADPEMSTSTIGFRCVQLAQPGN